MRDEQIGLSVRCQVRHDLGRRNAFPSFIEPREPRILRVTAIGRDNLEFGFNDIAGTATRFVHYSAFAPDLHRGVVSCGKISCSVRPATRQQRQAPAARTRGEGALRAAASQAALRPDEALDGAREQEQIGLPVGRKVGDDLFRWYRHPVIFQPSIPAIFGIAFVAGSILNLVLTVSAMPQQNSDLGSRLR